MPHGVFVSRWNNPYRKNSSKKTEYLLLREAIPTVQLTRNSIKITVNINYLIIKNTVITIIYFPSWTFIHIDEFSLSWEYDLDVKFHYLFIWQVWHSHNMRICKMFLNFGLAHLLSMEYCLFFKLVCQEWDLNPRPHTRTRILTDPYQGTKAVPWVWRLRPLGHPDIDICSKENIHPIWGSNPGPLD